MKVKGNPMNVLRGIRYFLSSMRQAMLHNSIVVWNGTRKVTSGLFQFVGFIGEGVKNGIVAFFTIPPCKLCDVRAEMFDQFRADTRNRIVFLEQALASEKREKESLRQMLAKATRTESLVSVPSGDEHRV